MVYAFASSYQIVEYALSIVRIRKHGRLMGMILPFNFFVGRAHYVPFEFGAQSEQTKTSLDTIPYIHSVDNNVILFQLLKIAKLLRLLLLLLLFNFFSSSLNFLFLFLRCFWFNKSFSAELPIAFAIDFMFMSENEYVK